MARPLTSSYNDTQIETASPNKLTLMLYDGFINRLVLTKKLFSENKQRELSHNSLIKAQAILGELAATLNFASGDIAGHLFQLYSYMGEKLIIANLKQDPNLIEHVIEVMTPIRDAWSSIISSTENSKSVESLKETKV